MAERHDSKDISPDQNPSVENDAHSKDDREAAQALLQLRNHQEATAADLDQQTASLQLQIDTLFERYTRLEHLTNAINPPEHVSQNPDQAKSHESANSIIKYLEKNIPKTVTPALDNLHQRCHCEPDDMRIIVRSRVSSILGSWMILRDLLQYHEARIRRSWTKLTKAKRVKILTESLAKLPEHHRLGTKEEDFTLPDPLHPNDLRHFFWPMMNLENLSKPKNFLLLLNARARHAPYHFMDADLASSRHPPKNRLFGPSWLKEAEILLSTDDFPNRFGILLIEELESSKRPHEWSQCYNAVEGFLILEVQHQLLGDLCAVVAKLLENMTPLSDNMKWPVQPEPPPLLPEFDLLTLAPTLQGKIADQPYRRPPMTDWSRVECLFKAAYTSVRDHFWQLREASKCRSRCDSDAQKLFSHL